MHDVGIAGLAVYEFVEQVLVQGLPSLFGHVLRIGEKCSEHRLLTPAEVDVQVAGHQCAQFSHGGDARLRQPVLMGAQHRPVEGVERLRAALRATDAENLIRPTLECRPFVGFPGRQLVDRRVHFPPRGLHCPLIQSIQIFRSKVRIIVPVDESLGSVGRRVGNSGNSEDLFTVHPEIDGDPVPRDGDSIQMADTQALVTHLGKRHCHRITLGGDVEVEGDPTSLRPWVLSSPGVGLEHAVEVPAVFRQGVGLLPGRFGALPLGEIYPADPLTDDRELTL
ncbi:hypothetical protein [Micromonospora sagamiensis]|uniref:hypothetical protein n=1 Tax=Micromonospora sagamiensis TaxID=47875 RepID=UPI0035EBDA35